MWIIFIIYLVPLDIPSSSRYILQVYFLMVFGVLQLRILCIFLKDPNKFLQFENASLLLALEFILTFYHFNNIAIFPSVLNLSDMLELHILPFM